MDKGENGYQSAEILRKRPQATLSSFIGASNSRSHSDSFAVVAAASLAVAVERKWSQVVLDSSLLVGASGESRSWPLAAVGEIAPYA